MDTADQVELLYHVLIALALGAAIGLEREYRGFEAGIRTNALVCAGAAMFTAASNDAGDSRIAAGVVQGVGFLGAGLIFQREATVHNLTTAATVWASASVGVLVMLDVWVVALGATAAMIAVLELQPISDWVYQRGDRTADQRAVKGEGAAHSD
jgi:putative Mg2+ transporter-C (MgtC) family protein